MIECIFDVIRCSANEDIQISAVIKNNDGIVVDSGEAYINIYTEDETKSCEGIYANEQWNFVIPANTAFGKCEYQIFVDGESYDFRKPIYFMKGGNVNG